MCAQNFRSCRKLPCCSAGAACWRHANSTKQPQCRRYDSQKPCHDTDEWLCPRGIGESELSASSAARVSAVEQCLRGRTLWLLGNSVNREQYFSMRRWLRYDTRDAPISVAQQKDECGGGSRDASGVHESCFGACSCRVAIHARELNISLAFVFQPGLLDVGSRLAAAMPGDLALVSGGVLGLLLGATAEASTEWRAQRQREARAAAADLAAATRRGVHVAWLAATPLRPHCCAPYNESDACGSGVGTCDGRFTSRCVEETNALVRAEMHAAGLRFLHAEKHASAGVFPRHHDGPQGWCAPIYRDHIHLTLDTSDRLALWNVEEACALTHRLPVRIR